MDWMEEPTKTMAMNKRDADCNGLSGIRRVSLCGLVSGLSIDSAEEQRALAEARRLVIDVVLNEVKSPKPNIGGAKQKMEDRGARREEGSKGGETIRWNLEDSGLPYDK